MSAVLEVGRLIDTGIRGAVFARRLAGDRILIRTRSGAIEVVEPDRTVRSRLATWGLAPGVSPDGRLVAFVTGPAKAR